MKTTFLLFILFSFMPILASATCTRADFTGTWKIYTELSPVVTCTLVMPRTGTRISTNSNCVVPGKTQMPLRGDITIGTDCHITGKITIAAKAKSIYGWISKGKDSISGIGWIPGIVGDGNVFTGVKL